MRGTERKKRLGESKGFAIHRVVCRVFFRPMLEGSGRVEQDVEKAHAS